MSTVFFGDKRAEVKAIGFDKDGTLFDALSFWAYVDDLRGKALAEKIGKPSTQEWRELMGWRSFPDDIDYTLKVV